MRPGQLAPATRARTRRPGRQAGGRAVSPADPLRCPGRAGRGVEAGPRVVVDLQRLLARPLRRRHVPQVEPDPVQADERPRIESTMMSAGSSSAAASGWRSFQRSSPACASAWLAARATSISGTVVRRRPLAPLALPGAAGSTAGAAAGRAASTAARGAASPACFS